MHFAKFTLSVSLRCLLWDKEVNCREKESENRDLKEKVVKLGALARHLEMQKAELIHQMKLQVSFFFPLNMYWCFLNFNFAICVEAILS